MQLKYFHIILLILFCSAISKPQSNTQTQSFKLLTKKDLYVAGEPISLVFSGDTETSVYLYCSNSYGTIILQPNIKSNKIIFNLPQQFTYKAGIVTWQLQGNIRLEGKLSIIPQANINSIESYIGPPSIEAGEKDYTMLVTIPTDPLDNVLPDSTKVRIKHQFLNTPYSTDTFVKNGIAYQNIYSEKQDGRIIISSECLRLDSKEYDVNVTPAIPTDFTISYKRIHDYADGNQITTFQTSELKDRYGNTVSDGTFVNFFLTDSEGYKSATSGATINGIATANFLHPDHEKKYRVKAYVEGMAESNTIEINYKKAIEDFHIEFSKDKRIITVGPIKSFINQLVPDGLAVTMSIFKNNELENKIIKETRNGFATFKLNKDRYPKGTYNIEFYAAGISKSFSAISYE